MTALPRPGEARATLAELPPLPPLPPQVSPTRPDTPGPVARRSGATAAVPSVLATAGAALLDHREQVRVQADEIDGLRERIVRLGRRTAARRSGGEESATDAFDAVGRATGAPSDDASVVDGEGIAGGAAALVEVRADVERCERRLRELSAAVSQRQVLRGRPNRRQAAEVDRLRLELESAQDEAARITGRALVTLASAQRALDERLAADASGVDALETAAPVLVGGWDVNRWAAWEPGGASTDEIRIGRWLDPATGAALALPCVVPFVGSGRNVELVSRDEARRAEALGLLQAIVLRAAAAGHGKLRMTVLDPLGVTPFPGAASLGAAIASPTDIASAVRDAVADVDRLSGADEHAGVVPGRLVERQHVLIVVDFPQAYDATTVEALEDLRRRGPAAGVHLVVHRHVPAGHGPEAEPSGDDGVVLLELGSLAATCGAHRGGVVLDEAPPRVLFDVVAHRLRAMPPRDASLPWDGIHGDPATWWNWRADERVTVPLGRRSDGGPLELWLGDRDDRFWPCDHAMLAAMPGAGRTTFLRNLVTSLAVTYRPDDVHLSLVDDRHGTDFAVFEGLPHVALVSLRTTPAQLRGILAELVADVRERRELFARFGVATLHEYRGRRRAFRSRGRPDRVARHVAVVDGYEQLFDGDDGSASEHLLELAEHGGAVGVHLVLAGRSFRAEGLLRRSEVFARLQQRWALPLAADELAATTELGVEGRLLAASFLDRPGRVVANDHAGADESSCGGRLAMLDAARCGQLVAELAERAAAEAGGRGLPATVVLDGSAPPELFDNPYLAELLHNDCWRAPDFLEELARTPLRAGGLGLDEWVRADRPVPLLIGVEDGGRRAAVALLSRRPGEHLVVVGRDHGARAAVLAASLVSAALVEAPTSWRAWIADRSVAGQPGGTTLERAAGDLDAIGVEARYGRSESHAVALVAAAAAEVAERRVLDAGQLMARPTVLLVLAEPDRVRALARESEGDGLVDSTAGADLRRVMVHGSAVGVHVLIGATSPAMMRTVLADSVVQRDVHHRVLMQASEDDSFAIVRSAAAARLGDPAASPPSAVLFHGERHDLSRLRPYVDDHDDPLARPPRHGSFGDQLARVCAHLARRSR